MWTLEEPYTFSLFLKVFQFFPNTGALGMDVERREGGGNRTVDIKIEICNLVMYKYCVGLKHFSVHNNIKPTGV